MDWLQDVGVQPELADPCHFECNVATQSWVWTHMAPASISDYWRISQPHSIWIASPCEREVVEHSQDTYLYQVRRILLVTVHIFAEIKRHVEESMSLKNLSHRWEPSPWCFWARLKVTSNVNFRCLMWKMSSYFLTQLGGKRVIGLNSYDNSIGAAWYCSSGSVASSKKW